MPAHPSPVVSQQNMSDTNSEQNSQNINVNPVHTQATTGHIVKGNINMYSLPSKFTCEGFYLNDSRKSCIKSYVISSFFSVTMLY